MPRRSSGGPRLLACPVARVGEQTDPAMWHPATDPQRAAAWKLIRHAAWNPPRRSNPLRGKTAFCESDSSQSAWRKTASEAEIPPPER